MSKVVVTIFLGIPRDDENGKDVPSRWINILNSTDTKTNDPAERISVRTGSVITYS